MKADMLVEKRMILVYFDICGTERADHRRRAKVATTLEGYGERVQKSVFECWLTRGEQREMEKRLHRLIKPAVDRFDCHALRATDTRRVVVVGLGAPTKVLPYTVL